MAWPRLTPELPLRFCSLGADSENTTRPVIVCPVLAPSSLASVSRLRAGQTVTFSPLREDAGWRRVGDCAQPSFRRRLRNWKVVGRSRLRAILLPLHSSLRPWLPRSGSFQSITLARRLGERRPPACHRGNQERHSLAEHPLAPVLGSLSTTLHFRAPLALELQPSGWIAGAETSRRLSMLTPLPIRTRARKAGHVSCVLPPSFDWSSRVLGHGEHWGGRLNWWCRLAGAPPRSFGAKPGEEEFGGAWFPFVLQPQID
jgi:hypothetical protein